MFFEIMIIIIMLMVVDLLLIIQYNIIGLIFLLIFQGWLQLKKTYQPIIISIDGNIGSGKSTLMKILKKNFESYYFVDEPVDKWLATKDDENKNLLTNFYENKNRWSYTFQNYAFITRSKDLLEAVEVNKAKSIYEYFKVLFNRLIFGKRLVIFTERSILTDRNVFAEMLHDSKEINSMEWTMYLDWYKIFEKTLKIDNVIYLKTDPDKSYERVNKRARNEEKTVALEYLQSVHHKHEKWLNNNPTVLTLDGNLEFEDDLEIQKSIITNIKKTLSI